MPRRPVKRRKRRENGADSSARRTFRTEPIDSGGQNSPYAPSVVAYRAPRESYSPSAQEYAQSLQSGVGTGRAAEASNVQRDSDSTSSSVERQGPSVAAAGVTGAGQSLPHLQPIQAAFGHHDVTGVSAHVGGTASDAADAMGARAYTVGEDIAFRRMPDLRTAAHEATHVIQQRAGVRLRDGMGRCGDAYERHADAVAERVARGEYVQHLLADVPRGRQHVAVQRRRGSGKEVPILSSEEERRRAIIEGEPARFEISDNPEAEKDPYPIHYLAVAQEVTRNERYIQDAADQFDLDPDFIRAIIWMETARGWYDVINPVPRTIRPMKVYGEQWEELGVEPADLRDPQTNIEVGTRILREIWDRVEEPTIEKVATLYNNLRATEVSEYGTSVKYYYRERPWEDAGFFERHIRIPNFDELPRLQTPIIVY